MTTQTLKRNCKNLFTNSGRLCTLERNIPKIKLTPRDKSNDRLSPSPRLKSFPPEKINRIKENVLLPSTRTENVSPTRQNIGHGDAANIQEKLPITSNQELIKKTPKSHKITYFYPTENCYQSEGILTSQKNVNPLLTHRLFTPNSFSESSPRNKITPRPIVSHLPTHRDNIQKFPHFEQEIVKADDNCQKTVKNHENVNQEIVKKEIVSEKYKETLREDDKIPSGEHDKIEKTEQNQEFVSDNFKTETNYEKQPIGGRVAAVYRESYLKENYNLQKEFAPKKMRQQVMQQLPISAPVFQRDSIQSNNFPNKYPIPLRMENIKQPNHQQTDHQLHNCQQHDSVLNQNHQQQKESYFYKPNFHSGMTSPQDFSINRQKYFQHCQQSCNNFQANPSNSQTSPNKFQVNPNNFQPNPNSFYSNPNSFHPNPSSFQIPNNSQTNPNSFQANPNNFQATPNNFQFLHNDKHSQDHSNNYHFPMNRNDRTQYTSFAMDLVNPQFNHSQAEAEKSQQIVPNNYTQNNQHSNQNKSTLKSPDVQQQNKTSSKVYYFTPQMLKDQELLLNTMQQQQFPEDVMMRQFQLLLIEQKKQLNYLESLSENEGKIIQRQRNNVSRKITRNTVDEKPEWMEHITPPRITYCEMEKIKCYGFEPNWNEQNFQNQQKIQNYHRDQHLNRIHQLEDQKCQCLLPQKYQWIHQQNDDYRSPQVQNQGKSHQEMEMGDQRSEIPVSNLDQEVYHRQMQDCLHNLQQQSSMHQQPLVQNDKSFVPHQKSLVPQHQFFEPHKKSLVPHQQSLIHKKSAVPHQQSLVQHQKPMIPQQQYLVAHQKSLVPQHQCLVPHKKSPQQPLIPQQQSLVNQKSLMVPNQQAFLYQQSLVQHHQPPAPDHQTYIQQQNSWINHCSCSNNNHHHTVKQNSTTMPSVPLKFDENCSTGENLNSVEASSLLRLRYHKEIVQPQQRNNGLQDADTIKEALEALTKSDTRKGFEYLVNLNKKDSIIKLNGTQEPGVIPKDFLQKPLHEKIMKNVSANGLENQRNPNNPLPPLKIKNFDNQLMEYPRSKKASYVTNNTDVPENENRQYQCFQENYIQNQFPISDIIIQHPHYIDNEHVKESAICENVRSHFVRYENSMNEIQEPRIIGGFTYLARKSNSIPS